METGWHKAEGFRESMSHAWRGLTYVVRNEKNFLTQLVILALAIIGAAMLKLSIAQFLVVILVSAVLLAFEMVNTALEMLADVVQPQYHERIGLLKDVTAGAVLVMATAAILIGVLIYGSAAIELVVNISVS